MRTMARPGTSMVLALPLALLVSLAVTRPALAQVMGLYTPGIQATN